MKSKHLFRAIAYSSLSMLMLASVFSPINTINTTSITTVYAAETNYHTVTVSKSDISSLGFYKAVQNALYEASNNATTSKPYKIKVAAGTYSLTQALHIYPNTYLDMNGVTVKLATGAATNMMKFGDSEDTQSGYYYENIILDGGTWDANGGSNTVIKIGHGKNVTLKNLTVKNVKDAHLMEVAGVDGLTITGCTFKDQSLAVSADKLFYEAIQLDVLLESHIVGFRAEDIPMKNVVIDNCTFKNVPRGIGSHTAILNNPATNIEIKNCTFTDVKSAAIQGMNWVNCTITNNTIKNVPRGIAIYSIRDEGTFLSSTAKKEGGIDTKTPVTYVKPADDQKIVIKNNTITCGGVDPYADYEDTAILVGGVNFPKAHKGEDGDKLPAGNYYISGVTISNNTIKTIGHGIRLEDTRKATISENNITYNGGESKISYYGIQLREGSTAENINNNTITKPQSNGIFLYSGSSTKEINGNTITSPGKNGIDIEDSTTTEILDNKITSPSENGIYAFNNATVETIKDNTITSAKEAGIDIDKKSNVTTIANNIITTPKAHGIYLHNEATVSTISKNTITKSGAIGINIDTKSKVTSTISTNEIESAKTNAIYLHNGANVKKIESNNITKAGKQGIFIDASIATTISKNKITSAGANGISLFNKGQSGTITKNVITKSGAAGINVDKNSKITKTISSNTITSAKTNAIYLHNSANVKKIESNTLKAPGKHGIFVEKSTATTISKNKITTPAVNGIYIYNGGKSTTITGNTISSPKKYGIDIEKATGTTVSKNKVTSSGNHGIVVLNKGKIKTIKENTVTSAKGYGIFINAIKCNMSIVSNVVSKSSQNLIHINPNSASYTVTVTDNTLTGTSKVDGIYASSGKVAIADNTIKSCNNAIFIGVKTKGTVETNTYKSNKVNAVMTGSRIYTNLTAPTISKISKSGKTAAKISWKKVSNATEYVVYRSTKENSGYKAVATVNGKTSYTDKDLATGKTYYYKVVAQAKSRNGFVTIIGKDSKVKSIKR